MGFRLGLNLGFAVNRFPEPEEWARIAGEDTGVRVVQLTADLLNPYLPDAIINQQLNRIKDACAKYEVIISSSFTGAFTRVNHLSHPDPEQRSYWVQWFKRFVDLSVELGASSMGSHFGIQTQKDYQDPKLRAERRKQNIAHWHEIGKYARDKGLKFLSWEPMSIGREYGETLAAARLLHDELNHNAPLPFHMCLDVDHGDLTSTLADDTDPYAWLREFASVSPLIHLKQSSLNKGGHWPFTAPYNLEGRIDAKRVLTTLIEHGSLSSFKNVDLLLELSFRERNPVDREVIPVLKESVAYWRAQIVE